MMISAGLAEPRMRIEIELEYLLQFGGFGRGQRVVGGRLKAIHNRVAAAEENQIASVYFTHRRSGPRIVKNVRRHVLVIARQPATGFLVEHDEAWRLGGKGATKPNTWRDAIACAETLIAKGYTTPAMLFTATL